jgi:hypothetical protein
MIKTYAMFDIIGVTKALKDGIGRDILNVFWKTADAWTYSISNSLQQEYPLDDRRADMAPNVSVVTFSDSALLSTRPEFEIDVFYGYAISLKRKLEQSIRQVLCDTLDPEEKIVYCIVNRDKEIYHPETSLTGEAVRDGAVKPAYLNIAGSGGAFANLLLADKAIKRMKHTWHNRFSLYCVGENAIPQSHSVLDRVSFKGFDENDLIVYALE